MIGFWTAFFIVVANMIGTGVFTTLGFQLQSIPHGPTVILSWLLGGLLSICGALCYAGLAFHLPGSGGEFLYLFRIYHPYLGFLAGWVSSTVSFTAPLAMGAHLIGLYAHKMMPFLDVRACALCVILGVTLIHMFSNFAASWFHNFVTILKILIIFLFIYGCFAHKQTDHLVGDLFSSPLHIDSQFFVSLIFVMYAYSGWNVLVYISENIKNPRKNIPKALVLGSVTVTVLYVLLQTVILGAVPISVLSGLTETAQATARHIWGDFGAVAINVSLIVCLLSTCSALVWTGPRLMQSMGEHFPLFAFMSYSKHSTKEQRQDIPPRRGLVVQMILAMAMLLTSSFEVLLKYLGFTLNLFCMLSIFGLFLIHKREKIKIHVWGYPFTPLIFLGITGLMTAYCLVEEFTSSMLGLLNLVLGTIFYFIFKKPDDLLKKMDQTNL